MSLARLRVEWDKTSWNQRFLGAYRARGGATQAWGYSSIGEKLVSPLGKRYLPEHEDGKQESHKRNVRPEMRVPDASNEFSQPMQVAYLRRT